MKTIHQRTAPKIAALLVAAATLFLANIAAAKVHLKIAANTLIVESFTQWTAATPWDQINHYSGPHANRPTIDLVLQLQALKAGGLDFDFELVSTPNYERAKLEVIQGNADLAAETIWDDEVAESAGALQHTDPVIRTGEFEKGIYALPTNTKLLAISSIEELRGYVGITVGTWALDVKTIEAMKLKGVEKAAKAENVFLMLEKQRADFTLGEFSSKPDMSIQLGTVTLVPVPNCKVAIAGARSWIVGKSGPNATAVLAALQKGTQALRTEGRIERAFKECGFLNPAVASWKRLF